MIRIPADQTNNTGIKYFEKVRDIEDIHHRVHDVENYKQRKSRYRTSGFRKERSIGGEILPPKNKIRNKRFLTAEILCYIKAVKPS